MLLYDRELLKNIRKSCGRMPFALHPENFSWVPLELAAPPPNGVDQRIPTFDHRSSRIPRCFFDFEK